jgi:hypothetical protein
MRGAIGTGKVIQLILAEAGKTLKEPHVARLNAEFGKTPCHHIAVGRCYGPNEELIGLGWIMERINLWHDCKYASLSAGWKLNAAQSGYYL